MIVPDVPDFNFHLIQLKTVCGQDLWKLLSHTTEGHQTATQQLLPQKKKKAIFILETQRRENILVAVGLFKRFGQERHRQKPKTKAVITDDHLA